MTKSTLAVIASLALLTTAACGDNTQIGDDDRFAELASNPEIELINVSVAEACQIADSVDADRQDSELDIGLAAATSDSTLTTPGSSDLEGPADPAFCGGGDLDFDLSDRGLGNNDYLGASVCSCDGYNCVTEAIETSFGCGTCVSFECGGFTRNGCSLCN